MINLAIHVATLALGALAIIVLVGAGRDYLKARKRIRARLAEIRNRRYDFRIYETSWKREF